MGPKYSLHCLLLITLQIIHSGMFKILKKVCLHFGHYRQHLVQIDQIPIICTTPRGTGYYLISLCSRINLWMNVFSVYVCAELLAIKILQTFNWSRIFTRVWDNKYSYLFGMLNVDNFFYKVIVTWKQFWFKCTHWTAHTHCFNFLKNDHSELAVHRWISWRRILVEETVFRSKKYFLNSWEWVMK